MYNIGDKVWYADRESIQKQAVCPECFGKKKLTVILGDDSRVTIDCAGCAGGYDPPRGYVSYYEAVTRVHQVSIAGIEVNHEGVEYKIQATSCSYWCVKDTDVFTTKEEAETRAQELVEEYNRLQLENVKKKKDNNRTWSWHVHYYRDQIRRAKKDIEYAEERLGIAKEKAKELRGRG